MSSGVKSLDVNKFSYSSLNLHNIRKKKISFVAFNKNKRGSMILRGDWLSFSLIFCLFLFLLFHKRFTTKWIYHIQYVQYKYSNFNKGLFYRISLVFCCITWFLKLYFALSLLTQTEVKVNVHDYCYLLLIFDHTLCFKCRITIFLFLYFMSYHPISSSFFIYYYEIVFLFTSVRTIQNKTEISTIF